MMMVHHLSGNSVFIRTLYMVFPDLSVFVTILIQYFYMYFILNVLLLLSFVSVFVPLLQLRLLFLFRTCDFQSYIISLVHSLFSMNSMAQDHLGVPCNYPDNLAVPCYTKVHPRRKISVDLALFWAGSIHFMPSYDYLLPSSIPYERRS
jgi:hypothetical protein